MFSSYSRLDLNIVVGPETPDHLYTTLSGPNHLPILIDYSSRPNGPLRGVTASALWRMSVALVHRYRVREISFGGWVIDFLHKFISAASNYDFPALESLALCCPGHSYLNIPATFLVGPDQPDLPLRRLRLDGCSLRNLSGLLLSARALTDLTLNIPSNGSVFNPPQETILLQCLQGMQCLRSLDLALTKQYGFTNRETQYSIPNNDIVPLLKLTRFHYNGHTTFVNNLIPRLSAPSLQDIYFCLCTRSPFLYFSRVIDDLREEFRSISVNLDCGFLHFLSSAQSGKIDHFKPSFSFTVNYSSLSAVNSTPSTKLSMAEDLALKFSCEEADQAADIWEGYFPLREFLRQFRRVRVLRVNPFTSAQELAPYLQQDGGRPIFPLLEEIELSDEVYQRCAAEAVAAFETFASARAGRGRATRSRSVKVYRS